MSRPPSWPVRAQHTTPQPRPSGMDLAEAADNYARQIRGASKRAGGFRIGDPVRRGRDRGGIVVRDIGGVAILIACLAAVALLAVGWPS